MARWGYGALSKERNHYFVSHPVVAQNQMPLPHIDALFAYSAPASTPPLHAMWTAWDTITQAADLWLETLTTEKLLEQVVIEGQPSPYIFGSLVQRVIYHYWYHTGENLAIRQMLGHTALPEFVGDIDGEAPYRPEWG